MDKLGIDKKTLEKMNFNYKDELVFNYVMVDVDKKKNTSSVKDDIEKNVENAKDIIKIEDSESYKQYQGV